MPNWTLGELMSQATLRAGRRSDIAASTVSLWVNQAIQDVALEAPQALLEKIAISSTSSGENRITLPSDYYETVSLSYLSATYGSAYTLTRRSEVGLDADGFSPIGKSTHYALYNNWLELWPSPDSSYSLQLRYRGYPSDLTATSAVPSLDTEWRYVALLRAEQYIHEYLGNYDDAQLAAVRYLTRVSALKDVYAKRHASRDGMRASLPLRRGRRLSRFDDCWEDE